MNWIFIINIVLIILLIILIQNLYRIYKSADISTLFLFANGSFATALIFATSKLYEIVNDIE